MHCCAASSCVARPLCAVLRCIGVLRWSVTGGDAVFFQYNDFVESTVEASRGAWL